MPGSLILASGKAAWNRGPCLALGWVLVLLAMTCVAAGPTPGDSATMPGQSLPLEDVAEVFLDRAEVLDVADIESEQAPFTPQRGQSFGGLLARGTLWIRARVRPWTEGGWTYLYLNNGSLESVTLYAPIRGTGGAVRRVLRGGWGYANTGDQERFISPVFRLPLDYDDSRPLLIAVRSPYLMQFGASLLNQSAWQREGMEILLLLGLGLGVLVALLLYNLVLYMAIGDRHYLNYLFYALSLLIYLSVDPYVGLARFVVPEASVAVMPYFPVFPLLLLVAMNVFTRAFLDSQRNIPRHDRILKALLMAPLGILLLLLLGYPWEAARFTFLLLHGMVLLQITAGVAAWRAGYRPARFFLLAVSAPLFGVLVFSGQVQDLFPCNEVTVRAFFLGFVAEALLLSLALGNRTYLLRRERELSERMLLEHSKFLSVGQMLSGVVHQLKRPVIHAGNRLMILEALLDDSPARREAALPQAVAELRRTIDFMSRTIEDVYRFYAQDRETVIFRPADQIELALTLLKPLTARSPLSIDRDLLPDQVLHGYPNAFAHVLLILIENAVIVLRERAVHDPRIRIGMRVEGAELEVTVADNAGGIQVRPIESIFNPITRPASRSGLGIGLGLARRLVETKLNGRITACNGEEGAEFLVRLPLA